MSKVKITLAKSLIGAKPNQKLTAESLGLRKIGDSIVHESGSVIAVSYTHLTLPTNSLV